MPDSMKDTVIAAATKPLFFKDGFYVRPGTLCTVLGEKAQWQNGPLMIEVMFVDGTRRFVNPGDVEVKP